MALRIRLVTGSDHPEGDDETRFLGDVLRESGWTVDIAVWSDPDVPWDDVPLTVLRSTWDYPRALDRFLTWVSDTAARTALHNPPALVRANVDKRYLLALAERGVPVVPSRWVADATPAAVERIRAADGWGDVVVKPAVGVDGLHVVRVPPSAPPPRDLPRLPGGWLVQPYVGSIRDEGERSVVLLDGEPAWAVTKRPPAGDEFRVQERWGGMTVGADPDAAADALAVRALAAVAHAPPAPLYARVDLLRIEGAWRVTEVEAIEPSLYLQGDRVRATRVEAALRRRASP